MPRPVHVAEAECGMGSVVEILPDLMILLREQFGFTVRRG